MTDEPCEYKVVQQRNFGDLVRTGRFSTDFNHKPAAQSFVSESIAEALPVGTESGLRILDCGCGPGAWLDFIRGELNGKGDAPPRYYGFDVTEEMVDIARLRLPDLPPSQLRQGDILIPESYSFSNEKPEFDVIFCYDVVQQLPRDLQLPACETMAAHLADGGVAMIFDRERNSLFGRAMGCAKFLRRYMKIPLVPGYYTAARYPPLNRFARELRKGGYETTVKASSDRRRRVMTVRKPPVVTSRQVV